MVQFNADVWISYVVNNLRMWREKKHMKIEQKKTKKLLVTGRVGVQPKNNKYTQKRNRDSWDQ